jgi:hypothetical protein
LANFIGNVDASICIGETVFQPGNDLVAKLYPPQPLKTCYRPTARPAALSGMSKMTSTFKSRLLLQPTSGFGLNARHGLNIYSKIKGGGKKGGGLSPSQFAEALLDSVFTVCAPSTSAESTRIYEALEAGSIPIVWFAGAEGGLPFGPSCPLPHIAGGPGASSFVRGADWEKRLPALIQSWQERGSAALDTLQREVQEWWTDFKRDTGSRVGRALFTLLTKRPLAAMADSDDQATQSAGRSPVESDFRTILRRNEPELVPAWIRPRLDAIHRHLEQFDKAGEQQSLVGRATHFIDRGYVLGSAIDAGRRMIRELCKEAERKVVGSQRKTHTLHLKVGMYSVLATQAPILLLFEAMRLAVKLRLWPELECVAPSLAWYDPYSVSLSSLKAESYWTREQWAAYSHEHTLTERLVRMANISMKNGRNPLLPEHIADIWSGGLRAQLVFSSLRLCLADGRNASRAIYGALADAPPELDRLRDVGMLDMHLREVYAPL